MSTVDTLAPDYGLDAPGVVRNLFVAGAAGLLVFACKALGLWPAAITVGPVRFDLAPMGLAIGIVCAGMGNLDGLDEQGRKEPRARAPPRPYAVERIRARPRRRLRPRPDGRGRPTRFDVRQGHGNRLWQAEDLSGNRPEATLENARREGVADRIEIQTADMRQIPFPDATFDAVVSCSAIHNLYAQPDRRRRSARSPAS